MHFKHRDSPYIVHFKRRDCPCILHFICRDCPYVKTLQIIKSHFVSCCLFHVCLVGLIFSSCFLFSGESFLAVVGSLAGWADPLFTQFLCDNFVTWYNFIMYGPTLAHTELLSANSMFRHEKRWEKMQTYRRCLWIYQVANQAILRTFRTPKNLSEEGFQLFSCLSKLST